MAVIVAGRVLCVYKLEELRAAPDTQYRVAKPYLQRASFPRGRFLPGAQ